MSVRVQGSKERQAPACRTPSAPRSQRLLSAPGDTHEREADRIAGAALEGSAGPGATVRATGGPASKGQGPAGLSAARVPPGGAPLPADLRADLEPRFRHDFSRVRVHADGFAARSAGALGARAFTIGEHVFLGE